MRFTIAASVLAQNLSLAGASAIIEERKRRETRGSVLEAVAHFDEEDVKATLIKEDTRKSTKKNKSVATSPLVSTVKSSKKESPANETPLVECDPDVGIFACDTLIRSRCVENSESTLGGFCVAYQKARSKSIHRNLQDGGLCDDYYLDCTGCDELDNGVGTYTCTDNKCIDDAGQVCGTNEEVITNNQDGSYSTSACFVVEGSGAVENSFDSPLEQYCYTVVNDGSKTIQCTLEIDQVECKSCSPVLCPGGSTAASLDCSNIDSVAVGNSCSGGLNVLDLLSGALTPPPTPEPTMAPMVPNTQPSSEPTSDGSRLMTTSVPVVVVAAVAVLAAFVSL